MNTNYSKIALLLALGVVAKVDALTITRNDLTDSIVKSKKTAVDSVAPKMMKTNIDLNLLQKMGTVFVWDKDDQALKTKITSKNGISVPVALENITTNGGATSLVRKYQSSFKSLKNAVLSHIRGFDSIIEIAKGASDLNGDRFNAIMGNTRSDQINALVNGAKNATELSSIFTNMDQYNKPEMEMQVKDAAALKKVLAKREDALKAITAMSENVTINNNNLSLTEVKGLLSKLVNVATSDLVTTVARAQVLTGNDLKTLENDVYVPLSKLQKMIGKLNLFNLDSGTALGARISGNQNKINGFLADVKAAQVTLVTALGDANRTAANKATAVRDFLTVAFGEVDISANNGATVFRTAINAPNIALVAGANIYNNAMIAAGFSSAAKIAALPGAAAAAAHSLDDNNPGAQVNGAPTPATAKATFEARFNAVSEVTGKADKPADRRSSERAAFAYLDGENTDFRFPRLAKKVSEESQSAVVSLMDKLITDAGRADETTKADIKKYAEGLETEYFRIRDEEVRGIAGSASAESSVELFKGMNLRAIESASKDMEKQFTDLKAALGTSKDTKEVAVSLVNAKTFDDLQKTEEYKTGKLKINNFSKELKDNLLKLDEKAAKQVFSSLKKAADIKDKDTENVVALKALFAEAVRGSLGEPEVTQNELDAILKSMETGDVQGATETGDVKGATVKKLTAAQKRRAKLAARNAGKMKGKGAAARNTRRNKKVAKQQKNIRLSKRQQKKQGARMEKDEAQIKTNTKGIKKNTEARNPTDESVKEIRGAE